MFVYICQHLYWLSCECFLFAFSLEGLKKMYFLNWNGRNILKGNLKMHSYSDFGSQKRITLFWLYTLYFRCWLYNCINVIQYCCCVPTALNILSLLIQSVLFIKFYSISFNGTIFPSSSRRPVDTSISVTNDSFGKKIST